MFLVLAIFSLALSVVDASGAPRLEFRPGEAVYVLVDAPSTVAVRVVDAGTGVTVFSQSFAADRPGVYLLWRTSPQTAEGVYKVYISAGSDFDVFTVRISAGPRLPLEVVVPAALAAGVVAAVWLLLNRQALERRVAVGYVLELPSGAGVEVTSDKAVFGREFFAKLGVPKEILQYISRSHFAIYRDPRGRFYIEDVGSKNGTLLNGRPIKGLKPQPLKDGDIITVAHVLNLRFRPKY